MNVVTTEIAPSGAALTPAERVEALMDAFVGFQSLERAADALRFQLDNIPVKTAAREQKWDVIVHSQIDAESEIVAQVKILMGNGILDRAAELLRANPGGDINADTCLKNAVFLVGLIFEELVHVHTATTALDGVAAGTVSFTQLDAKRLLKRVENMAVGIGAIQATLTALRRHVPEGGK
ncbi:MAG: hypothetical protein ACI8Q6_001850 [Granulosicoccus sp.]|jgi:hypothetical protein